MQSDTDINRQAFERADIVDHYVQQRDLLAEEEHLFRTRLRPGMDILDLGIGAGRTTEALAADAGRYIGLDFSAPMIEAAQREHPGRELVVGDAADLSRFEDASFDAVVFSFNGLDCLPDVAARQACLTGARRVLRPGGVFIVSSHNPRAVLGRAVVAGSGLRPAVKRLLAKAWGTARRAFVKMPQRAFWTGEGYLYERTHGGLTLYAVRPARFVPQVEAVGFRHDETVPATHPRRGRWFEVPWYYYAFTAV